MDNQPSKGLRPQLKAFHLQTEPWLFVINRRGIIVARLEGAFGTNEMTAAFEYGAAMTARRLAPAGLSLVVAAVLLSGCGGSGSAATVSVPKVAPARVFTLGHFTPVAGLSADHPTTMSFTVQLPDGRALTHYKTGAGPHTGVHLIIVRDDLAYIIHEHPPIPPDGVLHQRVTFPAPGPYRVLVDVYPNISGGEPNFQLFRSLRVQGAYHRSSSRPSRPTRSSTAIAS